MNKVVTNCKCCGKTLSDKHLLKRKIFCDDMCELRYSKRVIKNETAKDTKDTKEN